MTINQRLKKCFDDNDINIEDTALKIGVSKQALYNALNGISDPSVSMVGKICQLFWNWNPSWIMTERGNQYISEVPKDNRFIEEKIQDVFIRLEKIEHNIEHLNIRPIQVKPGAAEDESDRVIKRANSKRNQNDNKS